MLCAACLGSARSWARAVRLLRPSLCGARGPGPALPAPDVLCGAREMRDAEPEVGWGGSDPPSLPRTSVLCGGGRGRRRQRRGG